MVRRPLAAVIALLAGLLPALAQVPSTLPANTVLGRLGVTAGKPQAIPLATLFSSANAQPTSANLTALLALGSTGFPTRTGTDTWAQRTITGTANQITVTNGNGVSGNPTISLPASISITGTMSAMAFAGGTGAFGAPTVSSGSGSGNLVTLFGYNASGTANTESAALQLGRGPSNPTGEIRSGNKTNGSFADGYLSFRTIASGTVTERMKLDEVGNLTFSGGTPTGLPSPTNASDAAPKSYVDLTALGLQHLLTESRLATAAVLPNSPTYSNGASGVGATLTAGSNTTLTIDSTVAALNDIVLVKNQASAFQNGQYYVSTAGSGGAAWVLTRCTVAACGIEFDTAATMLQGSYTRITAGSTNIGRSYALTATVATVGATSAVFALSATSSADGILYTAPGTGGVSQAQSRHNQNILWAHDYGAVCDGVTDDTTAFTRLLAEAQTLNSPARFNGTCVTDSLSFTAGVDFGGTNQWTSVLVPSNTAHDLLSISTIQAVHLSNFRIDYLSGSGTAITCAGTGSANSGQANDGSVIENVRTDTPGISLKMTNCGRLTLKSSYFNQSSVNNVLIDNPVSCDNGDNHFIANTFIMMATSDSFKVKCGGGQYVIGNKFNNGSAATAISYSLGSGLTNSSSSAHIFKANSVEGSDICFSFARAAGTGNLFNVVVSGNELVCRIGITVSVSGGSPWMHTFQAGGNAYFGANLANAVYILVDGVYGFNAVGGSLWATHAATIAVFFGSQMATDSLVGGFAKANDGGTGGTWSASTLASALNISCSATCH